MTEAPERLELSRWRAAFARDAVAGRLVVLGALLEREVVELEVAVAEAQAGRPDESPPAPRATASPATATKPPARPARTHGLAALPSDPEASRGPEPMLAGSIREGLLADVLQMLSANLKTGLFLVKGPSGEAKIWFESGEVRHASAGSQTGEGAFFVGLASATGSFSFVETTEIPSERTITGKTQFLILEGLRQMDEEGHQHGGE